MLSIGMIGVEVCDLYSMYGQEVDVILFLIYFSLHSKINVHFHKLNITRKL